MGPKLSSSVVCFLLLGACTAGRPDRPVEGKAACDPLKEARAADGSCRALAPSSGGVTPAPGDDTVVQPVGGAAPDDQGGGGDLDQIPDDGVDDPDDPQTDPSVDEPDNPPPPPDGGNGNDRGQNGGTPTPPPANAPKLTVTLGEDLAFKVRFSSVADVLPDANYQIRGDVLEGRAADIASEARKTVRLGKAPSQLVVRFSLKDGSKTRRCTLSVALKPGETKKDLDPDCP